MGNPGLYIGQMCLLGIWLGLGTSKWRWVIAAVPVGIVYLGNDVELLAMKTTGFILQPLVIAAALLVVRRWKVHLMFYGTDVPVASLKRLQFSIRHLFYLTTAVAVLLVMAQRVGPLMAQGVGALLESDVFIWFHDVIIVGIMSLCFISITLAAVWACLGVGRPTQRILVVLLLAFFVGALFAYVFSRTTRAWNWWFMMPMLTVLSAAIVTASLLVVRSNGYRLVRRSPRVTPKQNEPE